MKALIIGYGSIGSRHVDILSKMDKIDEVSILSSQKNLPFKTINKLEDINKINPDYIVIASSTSLHLEQLTFLEKNFKEKIILVEKPILQKNENLKLSKNKVFVGYNLRFHPMIKKIRKICNNRKIWSIYAFCGSYLPDWRPGRDYRLTASAKKKTGGGVLLDLSHELDYIQWIAGIIKVKHVYSEKISNLEIDTDDILMLNAQASNGAKIHIGLNYFTRKPIRKIIIDGEGISIQADLITSSMNINKDEKNKYYSWKEVNRNYTYSAQHQAIIDNNFSDICSFSEGLTTMKLIESIKGKVS